jgi:hypothetical protein
MGFATFSYKNNSIETSYVAGETIKGTLNISFSEELASALMTSNFNGSIKLVDLLEKNGFEEGIDYSCTKRNCAPDYSTGDSISSFSLSSNEPKFIGFKITGDDIEIISLKFSLSSDATSACSNQIIIDVLDKNDSFLYNRKYRNNFCGAEKWGCFDSSLGDYALAEIITAPYCEKVHLPAAPAYLIGANIRNGTTNTKLNMELFSLDGSDWNLLGGCELPKNKIQTEILGCIVNTTTIKEGDFFVCLSAQADSDFKIRIEESGETCGTEITGETENFDTDFEIFAKPAEFDSVGVLRVNDSEFAHVNAKELAGYIEEYKDEKYEQNCSAGCVFPFKISGISQNIALNDVELKYTRGGIRQSVSTMYSLSKDESKVSSIYPLNIDLEKAGFEIPIGTSETFLRLYLGQRAILPSPKALNITPSFSFDLEPRTTLLGVNTEFEVVTSAIIVSSLWNFGDGTPVQTSDEKIISHRYTAYKEGGYPMEIELVRSNGVKAKRSFMISFGSFEESVRRIVADYEPRLGNLSRQIKTFPTAVAAQIEKRINISEINATLKRIKTDIAAGKSEEEYLNMVKQLIALDMPLSVGIKESGKVLPLLIGAENIDTDYIEQISGKQVLESGKEALKESIIGWMGKNYDGNIDYDTIAKLKEGGKQEAIATKIKINLNKKAGAGSEAAYLIINYPKEGIVFLGNYSERAVGSGAYVPVGDSASIEFILPGEVKLSEMGIYLSPTVDNLGYEGTEITRAEGFKWGRFILWIVVLLIVAFAGYIALQEWYKRKYESSLFKNPNELYNLINFIYNSRKGMLKDSEILKKLKDTGWSGEKISYAFNKIDGKRTGMYEIPIFRFFEQRKVRKEIAKRQAEKASSGQEQNLLKM